VNGYYKLSSDGSAWQGFAWDGTTGARSGPAGHITLTIRDGGRGDGDGTADGTIRDPGAPALLDHPMTAISPWPLVRKGDQQHPVETLQYLLRARGHNLTVDGIFGLATDAAVRAFQQQKGLAVDGIAGPATWSALIITVSQGSQGDAVRGVQEEFQYRNLSGDPSKGLTVDGIFGPNTVAAVRGFQQALHQDIPSVTVDSIVGPVTWQALVSGMLPP
jgi:peptidoglycan hydrolase-like protein with peptidoglycan-binding domain